MNGGFKMDYGDINPHRGLINGRNINIQGVHVQFITTPGVIFSIDLLIL